MRQGNENDRKRAQTETPPLDPIALSLALWLGLVVGVTGLMRLSEIAAANAVRAQQDPQRTAAVLRSGPMLLAPYGS